MASKRQLDAYRNRLAKISAGDAPLTPECLNAVVTVTDMSGQERTGTLVQFTYRIAWGLLGPRTSLSVRLCPECVDRRGNCPRASDLPILDDVSVVTIRRNGDGDASTS